MAKPILTINAYPNAINLIVLLYLLWFNPNV